MSKLEEKGLVPELRFPEFWGAGEWDAKELKDACQMQAGKFIRASEILEYKSDEAFPCYGGNGLRGYTKSFTHDGKYSLIGRQGALCGNVTLANGKFHATEHAVVVTPKDNVNTDWLFYKLNILNLNRFATGQAQPGLSVENLEKVRIYIPKLKDEQKKIADFLTTLDELIIAQTQKLEALKTHKKGLTQQLFPIGNEKIPKRRFPEFLDNGKWRIEELGSKTIKVGSGITPNGGDKNYKAHGRPFVRSQNIGWGYLILNDVAYIDEETHSAFPATEIQINDVLLNITGASIGRSAVATLKVEGGNVNQHVCTIRTRKKELNPFFLNQFLLSQAGQNQIVSFQAGGNRQGLNFAQIRSFSIPMPPKIEEQQKIANCFASIDDQITYQSLKIEFLNTYKKGLTQKIFPTPKLSKV